MYNSSANENWQNVGENVRNGMKLKKIFKKKLNFKERCHAAKLVKRYKK